MSHNLLVTRLEAAIRKFVYLASRFIIVLAEGRRFLFGLQARRRLYFVASRTRGAAPGASKVYLDLCREALDEITRYRYTSQYSITRYWTPADTRSSSSSSRASDQGHSLLYDSFLYAFSSQFNVFG